MTKGHIDLDNNKKKEETDIHKPELEPAKANKEPETVGTSEAPDMKSVEEKRIEENINDNNVDMVKPEEKQPEIAAPEDVKSQTVKADTSMSNEKEGDELFRLNKSKRKNRFGHVEPINTSEKEKQRRKTQRTR